jgi:hypothetical protein
MKHTAKTKHRKGYNMERKKLNKILWPIALLLLNSLWFGISDNAAPYEINDFEHTIEERTITLAGVFGQDKPMPSVLEIEFRGLTAEEGAVGWKIFDDNDVVVAQWSGELNESTGWKGELKPGTYRFNTTVGQGIITEQTLYIQPFGSYVFEGHIALSTLLILVAFTETFARKKGREYVLKKNSNGTQAREKAPFSRTNSGMPEQESTLSEADPWRAPKGLP